MPTRLETLRAALAGRTDGTGKPRKGYKANVAALENEIRRLSARPVTTEDAVSTEVLPEDDNFAPLVSTHLSDVA